MSMRCVLGVPLCWVLAFGCAEPNKFDPADLARADAQGGSGGRGGMGGAGGGGGSSGVGGSVGVTGGGGGTASGDAPVAGSSGEIDADPASEAGAVCNAGVTRCEGKVVEVCTVAGTWVMKETCSAVCMTGACAGMCAPGSKHCGTDQTPETCSDLGEWVPDAMPCPNVCSGMGLCTGMCKPGSKRCSGPDNLTTQTCDENGAWVNGTVCPNICSSGSCGGDCMPGAKRCGANQVQESCSDKGTWEPGMMCQFICMGAACAGECRPAAKRCSALVPQECDQNGRWQSMAACPNLCMNGACTGDCSPGQKRCSGNAVQTCSAAGRYVASETCPFVCQGSGVCGGQCVPGRRQCSGTTPQVCSNAGQWMNTTGNECLKDRGATCGSGNECESRTCVQGHCCNSGEKYCDGQCRAGGYCCNGDACTITNGSGSCMGGSCQRTSCNPGFRPQGAGCVDACSGVSCPTCQSCSNGVCGPNTATCSITNGTGRCSGGRCTVQSCSNGFEQQGEMCIRSCGDEGEPCCGSSCNGSGLFCGSGTCRSRGPLGARCGGDGECQSNACVSSICCQRKCNQRGEAGCGDTGACSTGSFTCVRNTGQCGSFSCGDGREVQPGLCDNNGMCNQTERTCQPGFNCQNNRCVTNCQGNSSLCLDTFFCSRGNGGAAGECIRRNPKGRSCAGEPDGCLAGLTCSEGGVCCRGTDCGVDF